MPDSTPGWGRGRNVSVVEEKVYVARCHTCEFDVSQRFTGVHALGMAMRWAESHEHLHILANAHTKEV